MGYCMAEQKVISKVSHTTTESIMSNAILLRFQACLKVDSYFFTFERWIFTLGRGLCMVQGVLMDLLMDPVSFV